MCSLLQFHNSFFNSLQAGPPGLGSPNAGGGGTFNKVEDADTVTNMPFFNLQFSSQERTWLIVLALSVLSVGGGLNVFFSLSGVSF